jgi:hypothetical protein
MTGDLAALIRSLVAQLESPICNVDRVSEACGRIKESLDRAAPQFRATVLPQLSPLLRTRTGSAAASLYSLLESQVSFLPDPWPVLRDMIASPDARLAGRALAQTIREVERGTVPVNLSMALYLARQVETPGSAIAGPEELRHIDRILDQLPSATPDTIHALYLAAGDFVLRSLAARLLDQRGDHPPEELVREMLGLEACQFLLPYLEYTRASHLDILALAANPGALPSLVADLKKAESTCNRLMLQEAIAELGWPQVSLGLEVRHCAELSFSRSFPLLVPADFVPLFDGVADSRMATDMLTFVAHGGAGSSGAHREGAADPVDRFRSYNLVHAQVLGDLLSVSPLTREKVLKILGLMKKNVDDYVFLFASRSDETAFLPGIYRDLEARIRDAM